MSDRPIIKEFSAYYPNNNDEPIYVSELSFLKVAKLLDKLYPGKTPTTLKYERDIISGDIPILSNISFTTTVYPDSAYTAGAIALPNKYTVENGEELLFQAIVPFGFSFDGWYKNTINTDNLISKDTITKIIVENQSSSNILYIANYLSSSETLTIGNYRDINKTPLGHYIELYIQNTNIPKNGAGWLSIYDGNNTLMLSFFDFISPNIIRTSNITPTSPPQTINPLLGIEFTYKTNELGLELKITGLPAVPSTLSDILIMGKEFDLQYIIPVP